MFLRGLTRPVLSHCKKKGVPSNHRLLFHFGNVLPRQPNISLSALTMCITSFEKGKWKRKVATSGRTRTESEEAHVPLFPRVSSLLSAEAACFSHVQYSADRVPNYRQLKELCFSIGWSTFIHHTRHIWVEYWSASFPVRIHEAASHESRWKYQLSQWISENDNVFLGGVGVGTNKQSCLTNMAFICLLAKLNGLTR